MSVASRVDELAPCPRAVIIGTFDGVHVGHRELSRRAATSGLRVTAVTFNPHPRRVLGQEVRMISSLSRRVELLRDGRVDLLAPADAAPLAGIRVCIRLAAAATYGRRHAGVAVRGSHEVSIARAA